MRIYEVLMIIKEQEWEKNLSKIGLCIINYKKIDLKFEINFIKKAILLISKTKNIEILNQKFIIRFIIFKKHHLNKYFQTDFTKIVDNNGYLISRKITNFSAKKQKRLSKYIKVLRILSVI
ncbi:hypothetical protein [Candidatus Vidania fulgoroideorum]